MSASRAQVGSASGAAVPSETPVVFIVDDDVSIRESLEPLIRWAGWLPLAFASAQEFLAHPLDERPRCLVLDVALPDLSGLDLQEQLAANPTETPIIFITGHGDIPMSVRAMKAGAVEFLTKPFERDVLLAAVRSAIERSRVALRQTSELKELRERWGGLTSREREVLAWVVAGLLNKQVGAALGMTEATVKVHRGRIMQKMKADSLADLVRMAGSLELPLPSISAVSSARQLA